jgi:DNA primase
VARYTSDSKDRVRDAVDMVDLVSARTELRRAGPSSYQGLCPFHDERTPSFSINPAEKVYYCFGCQASGDAFTFVQETDGVDFKRALELLADRYRVALEVEDEDPRQAQARERRERLVGLLERAAGFYERYLWESAEAGPAREYLAGRGLGEEVLRQFRIGFSPEAWDRLVGASRREGLGEAELLEAGLAQRSQRGGLIDRFRARIMFPLADGRGRVLGFGARATAPDQQPKYLNSADGAVYHKGRHLYAAHLARAAASRAGEVILCEGYTDVLALHQAGLANAVGLMGTALTAEQVAELGRMASRVELALDADSAGQQAMLRAAQMAQGRKVELRVVPLPEGTDPADLVAREGADGLGERVKASVPFVRFQVERVLERGELDSAEGRDRALEELRPILAALRPSVTRDELLRLVAGRLSLSEALVESMLAKGTGRGRGDGDPASRGRGEGLGLPTADRGGQTERLFLALCVALPEEGERRLAEIEPEEHFTSPLIRRAALHLREHLREPRDGIGAEDTELEALMAELSVRASAEVVTPARLDVEATQLELARVDRAISAAQASGEGDIAALATRRAKVKVELDRAMDRAMEALAEG